MDSNQQCRGQLSVVLRYLLKLHQGNMKELDSNCAVSMPLAEQLLVLCLYCACVQGRDVRNKFCSSSSFQHGAGRINLIGSHLSNTSSLALLHPGIVDLKTSCFLLRLIPWCLSTLGLVLGYQELKAEEGVQHVKGLSRFLIPAPFQPKGVPSLTC